VERLLLVLFNGTQALQPQTSADPGLAEFGRQKNMKCGRWLVLVRLQSEELVMVGKASELSLVDQQRKPGLSRRGDLTKRI